MSLGFRVSGLGVGVQGLGLDSGSVLKGFEFKAFCRFGLGAFGLEIQR